MDWLPVSSQRFKLAEAPHWDRCEQALYWVDIAGFKALRSDARGFESWQFNEPVSAFIPCERGDALVTLASGVYRLDLRSARSAPALTLFADPDPVFGNRPNEARCDAQGRLWLGTMQNNLDARGDDLPVDRVSGGLFCLEADGSVRQLLSQIGIANTLLWPPDTNQLLTADSLEGVIYRYPLLPDGTLGVRDIWAGEHARGVPDGSATDSQGYVWNARWGGSCLLRYAPDGCVDSIIELPVSHPTSCTFGGADLQTLFVTSASSAQASGCLDGAVLSARLEVKGLPSHRFAG